MQKWQQKQKHKNHELKVQNAKSSVRKYSGSRQRVQNSSKNKKSPTPKQYVTPINKILQIFQLEQYGPLLAAYGYPNKLTKKKSLQYIDQMMEEVAEKDKERFLSLLNTLVVMSKDVQKQSKTPKSSSKSTKIHYPPPPSTSMNSRQAPNSVQKSQKTTIKFRVKQKTTLQASFATRNKGNHSQQQPEDISRKSNKTRENSVSTERQRKKSITHIHSKATDDLSLVHDFVLGTNEDAGLLRPVGESNKIINRLMEKLNQMQPANHSQQTSQQIKLDMQKIKHMYLSFDSATLTSNIINIDLHQMIECLAMQVKQLITDGQITNLAKSNADKIKSLLHESFVLVKQSSKDSRNLQQGEFIPQKYLKSSLEQLEQKNQGSQNNASIKKFHQMRQIDFYDQQNQKIDELCDDTDKSSEEFGDDDNCSIDLDKGMKESSLWGNSYIASVITDFSCFDNVFQGIVFSQTPQQEDIKNFIQLVVMAGRMEKQVPIIAYVYLKRLLSIASVKEAKITNKNWRNIMLVTLIEASKIWDDQSLENHSFAKLIKPYTTLQINRLEKYLVYFLDYRLTIDQKQYSQAYFKLRKHIGQKQSTQGANLMRLDLKTIQKLQQSGIYGGGAIHKKNTTEKKQYFRRLFNKSF